MKILDTHFPPMIEEGLTEIRKILSRDEAGVLTTCSNDGEPHSCYMTAIHLEEPDEIIALTLPNSKKVENIIENKKVRWLFLNRKDNKSVSVNCVAKLIHRPGELALYLNHFPALDKAFFLPHQKHVGMQFIMIHCKIKEMQIVEPVINRYETCILD
jgi:hypothetical protein